MAVKKNAAPKKKAATEFKEFNFKGETFDVSGRLHAKTEGKGKILSRSYLSLCFNGMITVNGCWLIETEDSAFITWPQYKGKDDKYKSYIFVDEKFNEELDNLVLLLVDLQKE